MRRKNTKNLIYTALFIAIGAIVPLLFHAVPKSGTVLLPMHLPVFICGMVLGWEYGLVCGAVTPFLASLVFGQPTLFPTAVSMGAELATYGAISGVLTKIVKIKIFGSNDKNLIASTVVTLAISMICGRAVMCFMNFILVGGYTFEAFLTSAFAVALPGIVIQFVLIPLVTVPISKLAKLSKENGNAENN